MKIVIEFKEDIEKDVIDVQRKTFIEEDDTKELIAFATFFSDKIDILQEDLKKELNSVTLKGEN